MLLVAVMVSHAAVSADSDDGNSDKCPISDSRTARGILLEYDFNYNDRVELEEFRAVFAMFSRILGEDALGKSPAEVDAAFAATDSKKVGHICIEEFKPFVEQVCTTAMACSLSSVGIFVVFLFFSRECG